MIARNVTARGADAKLVAKELGEKLVAAKLSLIVVFADWRLDVIEFARELQRIAGTVPVVGCTAIGVIGGAALIEGPVSSALGLYGDDLRAGVGVATELSKHALARSRDAVERAAAMLGKRAELLDPARHVAFTLVEASAQIEEPFCIGSAAAAPQIRVVGGSASTGLDRPGIATTERRAVWANGEVLEDAGIAVVLESLVPFEVITSSHLIATDTKCVVTGAAGRIITELDGMAPRRRLAELLERHGGTLAEPITGYTFARFIDGVPYIRTIGAIEEHAIHIGSAVEAGHVLRIMRSGDLVAQTERDLAAAKQRLGTISAVLGFSCVYRDWEATARGLSAELAKVYDAYATTGFQSFGEQTGMLFVNHTLTALALGGG